MLADVPASEATPAADAPASGLDTAVDAAALAAAAKEGLAPDEEGAEGAAEGAKKGDPEKPKEPEKKSPAWDAYHRKQKALREKSASLQQAEADLKNRQAMWAKDAEELTQLRQLRAAAKDDPLKVLEAFGIDLSEANMRALRAGSPDEKASALEKKIAALEAERAAEKQQAAESQTRAQQEAARARSIAFLEQKAADKENYPELHAFRAIHGQGELVDSVPGIIQAIVKQRGAMPSDEQFLAELERRARIVNAEHRSRLGLPSQDPPAEQGAGKPPKAEPKPSRQSPKTLSQRTTSERASEDRPDETDEENRERVARILRGLRDS